MINEKYSESVVLTGLYFLTILFFYTILPTENYETKLYYFFIISLAVGLGALSQSSYSDKKKINSFFLWFSFSVLLQTLALRNVSGIDDPEYKQYFYWISENGPVRTFIEKRSELGYIFANYLISLFTKNYLIAQFIFSAVPLFLIYKSIEKYQDHISVPFAILLFIATLFFQMLSVSLVRMFIAISIVFYSIDYLSNNLPYRFLRNIIIASLFHYSALILLLFFFFSIKKDYIFLHWKKVLLLSFVFIFIIFNVVSILSEIVGGRYAEYSQTKDMDIRLKIFDTIPFIIISLIQYKTIPKNGKKIFIVSLSFLGMSFIISLYSSVVSLGRLIFYMNLGLLILLPCCYKFAKRRSFRIGLGLLIIVYSFLYLYVTQFTNPAQRDYLFPYENIFYKFSN